MNREKLLQSIAPLTDTNGATNARVDVTDMDDRTAKLVARSHFLADMDRVDATTPVNQTVTETVRVQS